MVSQSRIILPSRRPGNSGVGDWAGHYGVSEISMFDTKDSQDNDTRKYNRKKRVYSGSRSTPVKPLRRRG